MPAALPMPSYLLKATEAAAEDAGAGVGFDHDLALFLCLGGEVKPPLHCLTPAGKPTGAWVVQEASDRQTDRLCPLTWWAGAVHPPAEAMETCRHSPLHIQLHQLAHIEAELDVGDGAAGISLTAGTGT